MPERQIIKPLLLRQLFTLATIILLAILIFTPLRPYISGVFGAIIMYILTVGWMRKLVSMRWKRWAAATFLLIVTVFIVLLPIGAIILLLTNRVRDVMHNSDKYTYMLESSIARFENYIGFDISTKFQGSNLEGMITSLVQGAATNTLDFTIIIGLMYFTLYYMLINFDTLKESLRIYLPFSNKNFERLSVEVTEMIKSNAIAIPLVALMQGVVALLGFWIFGAPNAWFWFAVTAVGSMIPFVGTAIGMLPVILIMFSQGQNFEAIGLAIYGVAIVGSTDNVFRIVLQKSLAEIHPLITLFGVVIGIPLFGFLGLVFGPLLVSLFLLMAKIYKEEYY
ncbi:MAG: AI-2E family transporter [Flavobacteriaceae bacterium]|nr:AI-2E family transporter [Flavobacteriaceae bacterium]